MISFSFLFLGNFVSFINHHHSGVQHLFDYCILKKKLLDQFKKGAPKIIMRIEYLCVRMYVCIYVCVPVCEGTGTLMPQCECGDKMTTMDFGPHLCFEKRSLLLFTNAYSWPACLQASKDPDFLVLPLPPSKGKNSTEAGTTASTLRSSPHFGIYFLCRSNMLRYHTETPKLGRSEGPSLRVLLTLR